jgi:hypothetical protein
MIAFQILLMRTKKHPVLLFWEAMAYNEIRMSQRNCGLYFKKFTEPTENGFEVTSVPEFVENYCLDVLAKRTKPMRLQ